MIAHSLGIERDEPGFQTFILQPEPDPTGTMTWAEGHYDSMYGRIEQRVEASRAGVLTYRATVPANTTATLVPARLVHGRRQGRRWGREPGERGDLLAARGRESGLRVDVGHVRVHRPALTSRIDKAKGSQAADSVAPAARGSLAASHHGSLNCTRWVPFFTSTIWNRPVCRSRNAASHEARYKSHMRMNRSSNPSARTRARLW